MEPPPLELPFMGPGSIGYDEIEFFADDLVIKILPKFTGPQFRFITGHVGPFQPNETAFVPLWLASELRKTGKCQIEIPNWLTIPFLKTVFGDERTEPSLTEKLVRSAAPASVPH